MSIFTRRRLQGMLDDLAHRLSDAKSRDLIKRIENKRVEQSLPAEMELALLWGLAQIGDVEVEPEWWGAKRPEAYTESLARQPSVIEVAAASDNSISGEASMARVALEVSTHANSVRRGIGDYLYFVFNEESGYKGRQYYRRVLAPSNYELSTHAAALIAEWLASGREESTPLRIQESGLDVIVEKKDHKQIAYHNVFCSMPPEAHSIEDNPLYDALKRKLPQLAGAQPGTLRYILIADVGSTLLRHVGSSLERDHLGRSVSGSEILSHFVRKYRARVDAVVVFAPRRVRQLFGSSQEHLKWAVTIFDRPGLQTTHDGFTRLADSLPPPRVEGYQARSLFRQGVFSPNRRGRYLGCHILDDRRGTMTIKVSARAFVDLLAGRITSEQFRYAMGERPGDVNLFEHWLKLGKTLSAVQVESGGIDQDDDFLVLTFADDAGARQLRNPVLNDSNETT